MIPLMAIQMNALKFDNHLALVFTTVLDQLSLGLVDDDEETQEVTDRSYWEQRGTKKTVAMADEVLEFAKQFDESLELKYNKFYIGLARNGVATNFIILRPMKSAMVVAARLKNTAERTEQIENSGLDIMEYESKGGRYRIRLKSGEASKNKDILTEIVREAYEASNGSVS
jgi:hypothetical protein